MAQPAETPATTINGVAVDKLRGTIDAIRDDTAVARFRFRARNQWVDGA
jgi:hypothetical protein